MQHGNADGVRARIRPYRYLVIVVAAAARRLIINLNHLPVGEDARCALPSSRAPVVLLLEVDDRAASVARGVAAPIPKRTDGPSYQCESAPACRIPRAEHGGGQMRVQVARQGVSLMISQSAAPARRRRESRADANARRAAAAAFGARVVYGVFQAHQLIDGRRRAH